MRTIDKINQMLDEKGISGPRTILSESGVAARCRRELFENSDKFRVELFPIWKYFDLLRPAKQKAPSASHRAGGMQKGPTACPQSIRQGHRTCDFIVPHLR